MYLLLHTKIDIFQIYSIQCQIKWNWKCFLSCWLCCCDINISLQVQYFIFFSISACQISWKFDTFTIRLVYYSGSGVPERWYGGNAMTSRHPKSFKIIFYRSYLIKIWFDNSVCSISNMAPLHDSMFQTWKIDGRLSALTNSSVAQ